MAGRWSVVGKNAIQLRITGGDIQRGRDSLIQVDPGLTKLGSNRERIVQPTAEMQSKLSVAVPQQ